MPELPEVETTLRGIAPHIQGEKIRNIIVRHYQLRWPIPHNINQILTGQKINLITRRAKYLLFHLDTGTVILHLGMSGSLRILMQTHPPKKHDHLDIELNNNKILRFTDPRRFGAFLWTDMNITEHKLLKNLSIEPLNKNFSGKYLWQCARLKKTSIKSFIMNSKIVVGIGNIYAAEALFSAKIHPKSAVNKISQESYHQLAKAIKVILKKAIVKGGTTLKDFSSSDGKPGYFTNSLKVYGRAGLPCLICGLKLKSVKIAQRSTVYCTKCQSLAK